MKTIILIIILISTLNANTLEKVKVQLKWKMQFQFAGFLAAKEKGFYEEEGLDVTLLEYSANTHTLEDLKKERTTFAVSDSSVIMEVAKGEHLVALMAIYQESPYVLMSLASSNIHSLKDLKDKKIGLYSDINSKAIEAMLKDRRILFDKVQVKNSIEQLQNGEIDAAIVYSSNEPYQAKEKNIKVNILNLNEYGFDRYGDILISLEKTVINRPELVEKMNQATRRGFAYAYSHIDEMVELIYTKYNTQKRSKASYYYEAETLKKLLGNPKEFGKLDPAKVNTIGYIYSYYNSIPYKKENFKNFIYKSNMKIHIDLTQEERRYLKDKKQIKMCCTPDWMPFEAIKDGKLQGISSDYIKLISKKIHLPIHLVPTTTWKESLQKVKNRECDILSLAGNTQKRAKYLDFTSPHLGILIVLATQTKTPFVGSIQNLRGKKIAIVKGYPQVDTYKRLYPWIEIVEVDSIEDGFQRVEDADVFGYIDSSIVITDLIQKKYLGKININMQISKDTSIAMATRNDEKLLHSIFEKALQSISEAKKQEILEKWTRVSYKEKIDYVLILEIFCSAFIIVLVLFYSNVKLRRESKKREKVEAKLSSLNDSLEEKVHIEIEKNNKHHLLMMEQAKLAQMGEMIANIAHQWRQPLAQVNSSILVIDCICQEKGIEDEMMEQKLLEVEELTEYMSNTIENFQNFFNPNKEKTIFRLKDVVEQAFGVLEGVISSNFTEFVINDESTTEIKGYFSELQQVIVVLINNANDALVVRESKNPKITIDIQESDEKFLLNVRDNAGGIEAQSIEKVFQPYYTTKHKSQGIGIGLYMAKIIIEDGIKGTLSVKNEESGACFTIEIWKEEK